MSHWRKMFPDEKYLGSWDLEGHESVVVTIKSVVPEEMHDQTGGTKKKPVVHFEKTQKGLVLCKTTAKSIAAKYGNDCEKWVGQKITLCVRRVSAFGQTVDAIRIKED